MSLIAPKKMDDINADWLTQALQENGFLDAKHAIVAIEREIIGAGAGYASRIARFTLSYDHPTDSPASIVVKIEPEGREQQAVMEQLHTFEREICFYREVAPTAPLRLAKTYFTIAEPPCYAIGMEDLSDCATGDQLIGMPNEQVQLVLRHLAKLQAMYWDNDRLAALDWMPFDNQLEKCFKDGHWEGFLKTTARHVSPEGLEAGERFRHHMDWVAEQIQQAPKTIVHGDLREDNLLFGEPGTPDEFIIMDWQIAVRGCGAYDVARLMGGSETPAQRAGRQMDILRAWHSSLVANGVQNYSFEQAVFHLKLCAMSFCSIPVFFFDYDELKADERLPELLAAMTYRSFQSVVELNATDILPD